MLIVLLNSYILGPLSNLLFTYFYIRIDLNTKIKFKDTFKLSSVIHPFSKEMVWFPMKEFKSLPADEKKNYLIYFALKKTKETKDEAKENNFLNNYSDQQDSKNDNSAE